VSPLAHSTWYVTPSAVRDLLAIQGEPVHLESGPAWDAAVAELEAAVTYAVEGEAEGRRVPQRLASGALRYRGPKPRRLSLVVVGVVGPDWAPTVGDRVVCRGYAGVLEVVSVEGDRVTLRHSDGWRSEVPAADVRAALPQVVSVTVGPRGGR
jgi:hypothetical protein